MSDEYEDEAPPPPPRPKRPRKPIDWTLWIMLLGTIAFILIFGAITFSAPRRPFLVLRGLGPGVPKPVATVVVPATGAATPGATAAAKP